MPGTEATTHTHTHTYTCFQNNTRFNPRKEERKKISEIRSISHRHHCAICLCGGAFFFFLSFLTADGRGCGRSIVVARSVSVPRNEVSKSVVPVRETRARDACAHPYRRMSLCSEKRGGVISTTTKENRRRYFPPGQCARPYRRGNSAARQPANIFITVCQIQNPP